MTRHPHCLASDNKVVECIRMPLPVVKLATEWCGEYRPSDTAGNEA